MLIYEQPIATVYVKKKEVLKYNIFYAERVLRTRKQSGVHWILRVCKEHARVRKTLSEIIDLLTNTKMPTI